MKNKFVNLSLSEKQQELGVKFPKSITIKELYFLGKKMISNCDKIKANWESIMQDITPKFKDLNWLCSLTDKELEQFIVELKKESISFNS
jgi:hypothetical protein